MMDVSLDQRTGYFWCSVLMSFVEKIARDKDWEEAIDECMGIVRQEFIKKAKEIIESQKIEGKDTAAMKKIFEAFTQSPLTGWKWEPSEVDPERMVLRQVGLCLMCNAANDLGIQEKLQLQSICQSGCAGMVQLINPRHIVDIEKAICKGDEYCEFTVKSIGIKLTAKYHEEHMPEG